MHRVHRLAVHQQHNYNHGVHRLTGHWHQRHMDSGRGREDDKNVRCNHDVVHGDCDVLVGGGEAVEVAAVDDVVADSVAAGGCSEEQREVPQLHAQCGTDGQQAVVAAQCGRPQLELVVVVVEVVVALLSPPLLLLLLLVSAVAVVGSMG